MSAENEVATIELNGVTHKIEDLTEQQRVMVKMYMAWAAEKEQHELELSKVTLAMEALINHLQVDLEKNV